MTIAQLERLCAEATDRGDISEMDRLRGKLLAALRVDLRNRGIGIGFYEKYDREEERWYLRAAEAGSLDAIVHLGTFLERCGRYEDAARGQ